MKKKIIKKTLAILMIIMILAADFFALGTELITYATQVTNEIEGYSNIYFSTYFKDGEKEVKQINKSIKDKQLKLYAKIGVNNDVDCLENIQIEMKNSKFNIISSNKGSIEGNVVNLDYIGAGTSVELELGIEPDFSNNISSDMLYETNLELSAKYKYGDAPEGEKIQATSKASVKYQPDETTEAELNANIITNKVLSVNGENKRIVQLLIKSRLSENAYPVKQTKINATIPELAETLPEVSVLAVGELATNGNSEISESDYTIIDGKLQIILNNEVNANNQIKWNKDVYDELIVTYIYPENVDASKIEIITNSEIKLYGSGNVYTARYTKGIENLENNNVIIGRTETITKELYKGQLYANIETEYNSKSQIIITNSNIADEIIMEEGPDVFATEEREIPANTTYKTTTLNLNKMLEILGTDGNLTIKNGETTTVINKDTQTDANGNVIINHANSSTKIEIKTSKPVKTGVLELKHTKILENIGYTREQLKTVNKIRITNKISAILGQDKILNTFTIVNGLELKETVSKAELTIENNKNTLSATEVNDVTLGITLITDGAKYDLYKNPNITLKFPESVEKVELKSTPNKQNADEFEINVGEFNSINKTMQISFVGEQTTYPESALTQAYLQLNLNIILNPLAISKQDKIIMTYSNENASQYVDNGIVEKDITISALHKVITMLNLSSNNNLSLTQDVLQKVEDEYLGKELEFKLALVNNEDSNINNVRILGQLPTVGNTIIGKETNTLETTLKNITAANATIYYTENINATEDVENSENGWTTDLSTLTNAKLYLIKFDNLDKEKEFNATLKVQMPEKITESSISYTGYKVIYDTEIETNKIESSRKIGLISSLVASMSTQITAQVGNDILQNGDTVKEGEVIKYTVEVKNNGIQALENVELKTQIPEGTVLVRPLEDYVYAENAYYEEITDSEKLKELTTTTISKLEIGQSHIVEYEVRVKSDNKTGTQIINKAILGYDGSKLESSEFTNIIKESNVRVTIKRTIDESVQLVAGGTARYMIYVENLTDTKLNNIELYINSDGLNIETIENNNIFENRESLSKKIEISEIPANGLVYYSIYGSIEHNLKELNTYVIAKDSNGNRNRSNLWKETFPYTDAIISLTSPQNGQYIKEGDIVEYNITIKNNSEIEIPVTVKDIVPDYLQIQSISINGEIIDQNTEKEISNNVSKNIVLGVEESTELKIISKVGYISKLYNGKVISNNAILNILSISEKNTGNVTHILRSTAMQDENIENVISGFAWIDINENGQKEANEEVLSGTTVKIYDVVANCYVMDANGNILQTKTDNNGEYTFTKINNGSYLIIFECDSDKYEPTIAFAEGTDLSINSKAILKVITTSGREITVAAIEINNLETNLFGMNIGLKGRTEQPEQPTDPENPTDPDVPVNPEQPTDPESPTKPEDNKTIEGIAWIDENRNGQKDNDETLKSGILVRIFDIETGNYLTNKEGHIIQEVTDVNGKYKFNDIPKGAYILIFEYDTEKYEPTIYMAEGVATSENSKVIIKNININGKEITAAVTDTINLEEDISNINIGLKENLIFDLELNKYISRIVVQTNQNTKSYEYQNDTFEKVEINRKQIYGANVVLEYTIKVKNTGEITGHAKNIIDYLPSGLTFSSELNKDWYLSDNNLHTNKFENVELKPGEEKEIKLILTKKMTGDNIGLINNRAEIYQDYNKYGDTDIDSTPNNQNQGEDDFGSADVIIQIATGGDNMAYTILLMINIILIVMAIRLMIKTRIIRIRRKRGGIK